MLSRIPIVDWPKMQQQSKYRRLNYACRHRAKSSIRLCLLHAHHAHVHDDDHRLRDDENAVVSQIFRVEKKSADHRVSRRITYADRLWTQRLPAVRVVATLTT